MKNILLHLGDVTVNFYWALWSVRGHLCTHLISYCCQVTTTGCPYQVLDHQLLRQRNKDCREWTSMITWILNQCLIVYCIHSWKFCGMFEENLVTTSLLVDVNLECTNTSSSALYACSLYICVLRFTACTAKISSSKGLAANCYLNGNMYTKYYNTMVLSKGSSLSSLRDIKYNQHEHIHIFERCHQIKHQSTRETSSMYRWINHGYNSVIDDCEASWSHRTCWGIDYERQEYAQECLPRSHEETTCAGLWYGNLIYSQRLGG